MRNLGMVLLLIPASTVTGLMIVNDKIIQFGFAVGLAGCLLTGIWLTQPKV